MNWPIISSGVVCPGGMGKEALRIPWKTSMTPNAAGTCEHETFLVDRNAPELKRWQKEPRLRRASPISYYLVEAADQALSAAPNIDRRRTGVVAALFLGCLVYSIRFYRQLMNDGRRFASPLLFPETVFNSPLSHIVSTLGLGGPVHSQIGDTSSWAAALRTAHCWLTKGSADHVLVLGAEEFDPHALDAFQAAGLFRRRLIVGEGAGAILLSREGGHSKISLKEIADGYAFQSRREARTAARRCLENLSSECPVMQTAAGWTEDAVMPLLREHAVVKNPSPNQCIAGTASGAWHTILGVDLLGEAESFNELVIPYFGYSQQTAAVRLGRL